MSVKNFRSLKEIFTEDLQDMVILIGENSSGKTNILEAMELFLSSFTYHASSFQRSLTDHDGWYLWHKGEASEEKPIEFQITLSLDSDEIQELTRVAKAKGEGDLKVKRSIVRKNSSLYYQNDLIEWGSITLRREGDIYSAQGAEFKQDPFTRIIDRILQREAQVANRLLQGKGETYFAQGVEFGLFSFAQTVDYVLRKGFTYISLGRENRPTAAHDFILDSVVREDMVKRGKNTTPSGMMNWNRWRNDRKEQIWGQEIEQLECKGDRLLHLKGGVSLPLELEGGGKQAVLNLLEKVENGGDIVAVEEPENHLHPALQKRLVDRLRQVVTEGKKQILLATHSPFLIDRVNLKSIWFVYTERLESKAVNITTEKELTNTFWKIGVKPSDFLFANGVLVVDGPIDKKVYTDWARKIGKPFEDVGVLIIDAEGYGNITKYLNSEVIQRTTFRLYCLADKDAKWVKEKVGDVVPRQNILVLDKGALEDYYPREIVLRFAREMSPKKGRKEEEIPTEIKVGETATKLTELLRGKWWKRVLADRVIKEMDDDQINDKIRGKLGTVWKSLEG